MVDTNLASPHFRKFSSVNAQRRPEWLPQAVWVMPCATQAPRCTIGASGPRAMLAQTPQHVPTNFVTRLRKDRRSGMLFPLRYPMMRDTPAPDAVGAQN